MIAFIAEQLAPLGRLSARRMFGSQGLYLDGRFIGILTDDVVYLKVDDLSRGQFAAAGSVPFSYRRKDGSERSLSFYALPDGAIEDQGALLRWAREALGAALRQPTKPRRPRRNPATP